MERYTQYRYVIQYRTRYRLFLELKRSCNICRGSLCFLITVTPWGGAAIWTLDLSSHCPNDHCRCAPPVIFFPCAGRWRKSWCPRWRRLRARWARTWRTTSPAFRSLQSFVSSIQVSPVICLQHSGLSSHKSPAADFSITCLQSWDSQISIVVSRGGILNHLSPELGFTNVRLSPELGCTNVCLSPLLSLDSQKSVYLQW